MDWLFLVESMRRGFCVKTMHGESAVCCLSTMMVYFIVICINLILKGFEITCLNNLILRNAVASCFFMTFADHIAQTRHNWFVDVERSTLVLLEIFFLMYGDDAYW